MRIAIALLLLLVQLRPLAAGVVCLERVLQSEECAMPVQEPGVSQPDQPRTAPHRCPDAILCSPPTPAVLAASLTISDGGHPAALPPELMPVTPTGPALAPPFHPPRA
jgi:hypothetical protein